MTDNERIIDLLKENTELSKLIGCTNIGVFKNFEQEIRKDNEFMRKLVIEFKKEGLIVEGENKNER